MYAAPLPPPRRSWVQVWTLPILIVVLVACVGAAVYVAWPHERPRRTSVPEPSDTAIVEPPPMEGPEGAALGDARSFIDVYALAEAETILFRIVRQNPRNALAHAYLARAAYRRGQMKDGSCAPAAVAAAEREVALAEALQPGLADATLVRAYLKFYAFDFAPAKQLGLAAERADPSSLRVALFLAQLAARAGRLDETEERASALVLRVREGFVLDRAYDLLDEVYTSRGDRSGLVGLDRARARHPGHDLYGRAR
ncbi:hypothetical protein BH11MYX4_BH11MYX4_03270 [soil metagenome]